MLEPAFLLEKCFLNKSVILASIPQREVGERMGQKDSAEVSKTMRLRPSYGLITVAILVVAVALTSVGLSLTSSAFESIREVIITFWISFCVGIAGAGVYLSLLLMTEKNIVILKNDLIKDLSLMTFLFLLSGGFVAAITQTSTGILTSSGIQAVFMLGFGWQGAISGVAGTGTRAKLVEDNRDVTEERDDAKERAELAKEELQKENRMLKEKIRQLIKQGESQNG